MKISTPALLCVLMLASIPARADGSLFVHATEGAVHLRWNAPLGEPYDGFQVERQPAAGGAWTRLNESPVTRMADVGQIRDLLGPLAENFLTFFDEGQSSISSAALAEVMNDPVARGLIQLFSVKIPAMGTVLGEVYQDRMLEDGGSFRYRIVRVSAGKESVWAESGRTVTHGVADTVPLPSGLRGEGAEETAQLSWDHDEGLSRSGRLVAYRIYRAVSPSGHYDLANYDSVVPTKLNGVLPEFLYLDQYLENGRPYWFRISGVNVLGFEGARSEAIKVVPKDMTPPPPPQNFRGRLHGGSGEGGAMLQWDPVAVADLEGYRIYRGEEPNGEYLPIWPDESEPTVPRITYIDADVPEGAIYWYYIVSVDHSQNESRSSDRIQIFREDRTPPARVTDVEAVAIDDGDDPGVHLTWAPNDESDLSGYLVQRTTRISGTGDDMTIDDRFFAADIHLQEEPRYVDPVPVNSESRYAYRVLAVDEAGNSSEPSEVVIARMPDKVPPTRPAIQTVRVRDGKVAISWLSNVEEDLAGYRVYRSEDDTSFAPTHPDLVEDLEFLDSPGAYETVFHYRVTALDLTGNESDPSVSLSVKFRDDQAPPAPPIERIDVEDAGLHLFWGPLAEDIDVILVYRQSEDESSPKTIAQLVSREQDFLDNDVQANVEYRYFLRVTDERENLSPPGRVLAGRLDE